MMHKTTLYKSVLTLALLFLTGTAIADNGDNYYKGRGHNNQSAPTTLLIKFIVSGTAAGPGLFSVSGTGYAPIVTNSGTVLGNVIPGLEIAKLEGAQIQMLGQMTDPVVNFTCLSDSCRITLKDGTVLKSDPDNLPLEGRMANVYGTMDNSEGHIPVRILGCGGMKGIAGPMQGWVGSICFNGTFNVEDFFSGSQSPVLTGGSNCTITMHDPKPFPVQ